jgi:hypothetical protein
MRAGKVVEEAEAPHVGIGEVFVIAGQSNSTNYGERKQQTKSRMVAAFSGEAWQIADDPQPGAQDGSKKGSFIPPFGDALYEEFGVPNGVACVGHGFTSVRQWLPKGERMTVPPTMGRFVIPAGPAEWESTGELFDGMMRRIAQPGPAGFRALLWHQGRSGRTPATRPRCHRRGIRPHAARTDRCVAAPGRLEHPVVRRAGELSHARRRIVRVRPRARKASCGTTASLSKAPTPVALPATTGRTKAEECTSATRACRRTANCGRTKLRRGC